MTLHKELQDMIGEGNDENLAANSTTTGQSGRILNA